MSRALFPFPIFPTGKGVRDTSDLDSLRIRLSAIGLSGTFVPKSNEVAISLRYREA